MVLIHGNLHGSRVNLFAKSTELHISVYIKCVASHLKVGNNDVRINRRLSLIYAQHSFLEMMPQLLETDC